MNTPPAIPDALPDGPEWHDDEEGRFVAALCNDVEAVIRRYEGAVSRAEIVGVLETLKQERILRWLKEREA